MTTESRDQGATAIVCGGRDFADEEFAYSILNDLHGTYRFKALRHGAARGADTIAGRWARATGVHEEAFPADWKRHGRGAGPMRNGAMLVADPAPTVVIAFEGGAGTADMVRRARAAGVTVVEVRR